MPGARIAFRPQLQQFSHCEIYTRKGPKRELQPRPFFNQCRETTYAAARARSSHCFPRERALTIQRIVKRGARIPLIVWCPIDRPYENNSLPESRIHTRARLLLSIFLSLDLAYKTPYIISYILIYTHRTREKVPRINCRRRRVFPLTLQRRCIHKYCPRRN